MDIIYAASTGMYIPSSTPPAETLIVAGLFFALGVIVGIYLAFYLVEDS